MTRILFVCHGNICRSPMAEFVMKDLIKKAGLEKQFEIASAATSAEEIGNPVYPPARRELAKHGIGCAGLPAVSAGRIMIATTILSAWIGPTSAICAACGTVTRQGKSTPCWTSPGVRGRMWQTLGTLGTSLPPGGMCVPAARDY